MFLGKKKIACFAADVIIMLLIYADLRRERTGEIVLHIHVSVF